MPSRAPRTLERNLSNPQTALEREIAALGPWFHNLHLPGGLQTAPEHPLGDFPACKWRRMAPHIPDDLTGYSALDIGCNAGFYSFELARRGARVIAIDTGERYLRQASWAADKLGVRDRIRFEPINVYDVLSLRRTFDLVLFLGVFYHLRHPLLGLDLATAVTRTTLFFQTLTMPQHGRRTCPRNITLAERGQMLDPAWPKMAFVEKRLEGDPTNWWVPNDAAVKAMLRSCGWRSIHCLGEEIYHCGNRSAEPLQEAESRLLTGASAGKGGRP
jgi:tRNA (mo5U34)-methyltransferase